MLVAVNKDQRDEHLICIETSSAATLLRKHGGLLGNYCAQDGALFGSRPNLSSIARAHQIFQVQHTFFWGIFISESRYNNRRCCLSPTALLQYNYTRGVM